ncbi:MAG: glutamine--fructose-6-phosphate transaminase (isomerizing) [Gammaproteobacteria bacterium]|nr:glutamine--fructose-6-phosphate transaminase (isomerizing) [Gammaproteobacteria bacterium]
MCGIIGAVAKEDTVKVLLDGLSRLEYRGYDSAGLAVLQGDGAIGQRRAVGKIVNLRRCIDQQPLQGRTGIAHTRWATHGVPSEANAHPHISHGKIAIVHNGIIENHRALREQLQRQGYQFSSETDSEVIAHLIHYELKKHPDTLEAVRAAISQLQGAYAVAVLNNDEPGRIIVARHGSPLVIGIGDDEHFIASDVSALIAVTRQFMFLEDGDIADLSRQAVSIIDRSGHPAQRAIKHSSVTAGSIDRGGYRHYMLKEIFEQPTAVAETLEGRITDQRVLPEAFGVGATALFARVRRVRIIACGTSHHAGMVARYWIEALAGLPCVVEVASEFRYRKPVVEPDTLIVTVSQSGETADTISALKEARRLGYSDALAICNVPESTLVREANLCLMTRAGPEIGVASTKAFTTQLTALLLLTIALGRQHGMSSDTEQRLVRQLQSLPRRIEDVLTLDPAIAALAQQFGDKQHALFLGRGSHYPIALEGALKLKEISYIHAEAYPAGELKHGPLALIDADMPVIAVAPNNDLLEKLRSNLQEVRARGGSLLVFADETVEVDPDPAIQRLDMAAVDEEIAPIVHTVPLQLLAYHVAVLKGTDVDQPRNLAKSVTVE